MNYTQQQIEKFMLEAVLEGRKAREICSPNPPVGCVLVRDGEVISRGHTQKPGCHHAEAMALEEASGDLSKTAAFVTLEPCSFFGRTPSCARTLVKRGIRSVYVGMIDPHPKNRGTGIDILREAGLDVEVGILEDVVREDLTPYLES